MYNGYTNYETWACSLYLDSIEQTQRQIYYWTIEILDSCEGDKEIASENLCDWLEDLVKDDFRPIIRGLNGFYDDMLTYSLSKIDFYNIAQSCVESYYNDYLEEV